MATNMDPSITTTTTTSKDGSTDTLIPSAIIADGNDVDHCKLSPEDKQELLRLYQTCRPHLQPLFNGFLQFCDAVDEEVINYEKLLNILVRVKTFHNYSREDVQSVVMCAAASGFAEQAVKVLRLVIGHGALFSIQHTQTPTTSCGAIVLDILAAFTDVESGLRRRLAETGIFENIVEVFKMIRYVSPEIVDRARFCGSFLAILHNCCKDPNVAAMVKDMDIVPHIAPFMDKSRNTEIRFFTLLLLGFVVRDTELNMAELDHVLLKCCTTYMERALHQERTCCEVEEVAFGLSTAARLDFNKRLIVAKEGAIELLKAVLLKGKEKDCRYVLAVFAELAKDSVNAKVFQRDKELMKILSAFQLQENSYNHNAATTIINLINAAEPETENVNENTSLADVLAKQSNTLIILDVGKVEFILCRLFDLTSGRNASGCQVTGVKMVKALKELAKHESYRREIMARGGLSLLQKFFQRDGDDGRLESISLLLELSSCREHSVLIQADTELMESVQRLTDHDNQVRQAASQLLEVVRAPGAASKSTRP